MTEQQSLLEGVPFIPVEIDPNPCRALFGAGPEGKHCDTCAHIYRSGSGQNRYLKCEFRTETRGPGSDHRARWNACGKYDQASESISKPHRREKQKPFSIPTEMLSRRM